MKLLTFVFVLSPLCALAFPPTIINTDITGRTQLNAENNVNNEVISKSRRNVVSTIAALGGLATVSVPKGAFADVSDGDTLPDGVAQFSRIVRSRNSLKRVTKRVSDGSNEMDDKEWDNVSQFLRRMYTVGDDMKYLSSRDRDDNKKAKGLECGEELKKYSKAADIPVNQKDAKGFIAISEKMDGVIGDYLVLLRDTPDEI